MEKLMKQCVGIDCSKDELVCCFGYLTDQWQTVYKANYVFSNTGRGYKQLLRWSEKLADKNVSLCFVVEATGIYHEKATYFLFDAGKQVNVVLPNKAKHFAQTMKVRTVNDKECAKMLTSMGLEKQLDAWQKPDVVYAHLKQLTRERESVIYERTATKNQIHAEEHSAFPIQSSLKRMKKRIQLMDKQVEEIEQDIVAIVESHPALNEKIKKICTIKGVGFITAITVVAEANGFNLIRNSKQLVNYAGYDVVEKQSGTSVRGKSRISGKGNKHIRKAMHFPALTSVMHDAHHKALYTRLESKHGIKMKAYTAVQRKLLVLIYALWKKDECYDPGYRNRKSNVLKNLEQPTGAALTELDLVRS